MAARTTTRRGAPAVWLVTVTLVAVVLVYATVRLLVDVPHLLAGTLPDAASFERRYVEHPVLAYLHIGAGVAYLLGGLHQLARPLRDRAPRRHRLVGRVVLPCGLVAGVSAVAFGVPYAWGGASESAATVVFAAWFVACLVLAYRFVRRGDVVRHRRFMIRAYAVGLAVATIRFWIALFQATGLLGFQESFGPAFWLAFVLHVLVAELYLARRPAPDASPDPA